MMILIGVFVAAGGWLYLIAGVGVSVGGMQVANIHSISIANNVILLGYFLVIVGVIAEGFKRLSGASTDTGTTTIARPNFAADTKAKKEGGLVTEDDYLKQLADAKVFNKER